MRIATAAEASRADLRGALPVLHQLQQRAAGDVATLSLVDRALGAVLGSIVRLQRALKDRGNDGR